MRIDGPAREVVLKVVYYGPGMAGKTTNLTVIHDRVPSQAAGDLVMVDTHSERTLRFDLLAVEMGEVRGHQVRFDFYTVPGQSYYAATRRAVLAGADAVVFVADSRREALDENIEAMNEMLGNLRHHALAEDIPVVMQYNKQDLPTALRPEQLEPLMNVRGWPSVPSVAIDGQGVMETMRVIADLALERARRSDSGVPQVAADQPTAAARSGSWLISCYRCQAMLEIGNAAVGMIYACGVCGSALEVMDTERGLTRAPAPGAGSGSGPRATVGEKPRDDSAYGMQAIPDQAGAGALGTARGAPAQLPPQVSSVVPFEVPGFDLIAPLDESVQGRRARVRERSTGRSLRALTLSTALMRQPGYQQALEPHVRLASQVKHPYILPLAALQPTRDAAALFSTDPADYEPLGHILARRRALAPPHAMGIIRQLALALEEAARHGVVHGWLRPEVVLVSPEGNVLLDELAVPKNHRYLVRELSGASAATEYYLAPEHLSDETRSDVRADIFMLGALLFRMMTGEGLVTGYNAHEALHKVVANGARTLRSVQGGVSRDLDLFFQKLVAAERKDRFQGYREVIDTLDRFGGGAKRQTLRLTSNISNPAPGSGSIRRSGTVTGQIPRGLGGTATGPIPRIGTASMNRSGTGTARRGSRTASGEVTASRRKEPESSTGIIVLVVVAVLLIGGAVGFYVLGPVKVPTRPALAPLEPLPEKPKPPEPAPVAAPTVDKPKPLKGAFAPTPAGQEKPTPAPIPVATPVATVPAGVDGPVGGTPVPATATAKRVTSEERVQVILEIGSLERSEHFAEALALCDTLPSEEDTKNVGERVRANHDLRKQAVEKEAAAGTDAVLVGALLTPPQTFWGFPGDVQWAKGLAADAEKRLGRPVPLSAVTVAEAPKDPAVAVAPTPAPTLTPPVAPVVAPVAPDPAKADLQRIVQIDSQITAALLVNNQNLVQQQLTGLPEGAPETAAIKHKVVLWNSRGDVLARIISEHPPAKLRVRHPTTAELWDVTGATAAGVTITSPNDSRTELTWPQVAIKDVAELFRAAAAVPAAKGDDHALATIMLLAAGDPDLAGVQLRKAKGVLAPEVGGELELLIALERQRDVNDAVAKGNDALKVGNAKGLQDAFDALRKVDKTQFPQAVEPLARFETALKNLGPAHPGDPVAATPSGLKDSVTFDMPDDLPKGFPERSSNWQVSKGLLSNLGDNAWLERRDLASAKAVSIVYQIGANRGGLVVNFRSVQVVLDFSANTYEVKSKTESRKPKAFPFTPRISNFLRIDARDNGTIGIDLNNGRETAEVHATDLLPVLHFGTNGGAMIMLDEFAISRGYVAIPGAVAPGGAGGGNKAEAFSALNLVPFGKATLDENTVVLPGGAPDSPSGIGMPIREGMIGAGFEAKGGGKLRIQLGQATDRTTGTWVDIDLVSAYTEYKVVWKDTMLVITDHAGNAIAAQKIDAGPRTHLLITALAEAKLKSPPKPTYP